MRLFGLTISALGAVPAAPFPMSWPGCTAGPNVHKGTKACSFTSTVALLPRAAESNAAGSQSGGS